MSEGVFLGLVTEHPPQTAVRLLALRREDPFSWPLMPEVLERVREFCHNYDTDTGPAELTQAILDHFVAAPEKQAVRVVVALADDEVAGHLVVSLDPWCGKIIATIVQYELDVAVPREALRDMLDQIAWWAKGKGASILRVLALHTDERGYARARLFRSVYGFRPQRVMLDRDL